MSQPLESAAIFSAEVDVSKIMVWVRGSVWKGSGERGGRESFEPAVFLFLCRRFCTVMLTAARRVIMIVILNLPLEAPFINCSCSAFRFFFFSF